MVLSAVIIKSACDCFTIYDASTWSDPPLSSDVTAVTVNVSVPGQVTPYSYVIPIGDIPDLFDPAIGVEICATDLGLTSFADNMYYIEYVVTYTVDQEPVTVTYTIITGFLCTIDCCMRKARLNVSLTDCESNEKLKLAELIYEALQESVACGNVAFTATAISWLSDFCANCLGTSTTTTPTAGCGCSS